MQIHPTLLGLNKNLVNCGFNGKKIISYLHVSSYFSRTRRDKQAPQAYYGSSDPRPRTRKYLRGCPATLALLGSLAGPEDPRGPSFLQDPWDPERPLCPPRPAFPVLLGRPMYREDQGLRWGQVRRRNPWDQPRPEAQVVLGSLLHPEGGTVGQVTKRAMLMRTNGNGK